MELKIIKTLAMLPGQASGSMAWGQNLFPTSSFLLIQSQRQECGDNCVINYRKLKSHFTAGTHLSENTIPQNNFDVIFVRIADLSKTHHRLG